MAYMSQEKKKILAPRIKDILKKYGMKGTISVNNHSTLVVTLTSGPIDFGHIDGHTDVNHYWIHDHYEGTAREFLEYLKRAMCIGNWDNSDAMTDYFDVGWYITIRVGRWNKPYVLTM